MTNSNAAKNRGNAREIRSSAPLAAPRRGSAPYTLRLARPSGSLPARLRELLPRELSLRAFTAFQRRVYEVVSTIPRGEVRTYGWVAKQIGNPRAARAVGQALNANPYPGPIPCHRVVGANGNLVGYALGLEKKRRILKAEGVTL